MAHDDLPRLGHDDPSAPLEFSPEMLQEYASAFDDIALPPIAPVESQVCGACERSYPLTSKFWHRDSDSETGYRVVCKQCRQTLATTAAADRLNSTLSDIERRALDTLGRLSSKEHFENGSAIPHLNELYESMISAFGGADGLGMHLMATFLASKPGSKQRVQILQSLLRVSERCTEIGAVDKPLAVLTDDEIDLEIGKRIRPMVIEAAGVLRVHGDQESDDGRAAG